MVEQPVISVCGHGCGHDRGRAALADPGKGREHLQANPARVPRREQTAGDKNLAMTSA
jgi:hypothetical protein